jgi:NTP pyrophosphatase (non-canonical NTP hydrolase)
MTKLSKIQDKVFDEYIKNGYLEEWTADPVNDDLQKKLDIAELGLITTEITEAIEEVREKEVNLNNLSTECADIIIRTLNFMSRKGIPATFWILEKDKKNHNRGKRHGRAV